MKRQMIKIVLIIILIFNFNFINAQDNLYSRGMDNGHMWISLSQPTNKLTDYKLNYLASLLENQKIKKMSGVKPFPLFNCEGDLLKIDESKKSVDPELVVKMIDNFYSNNQNLIVPVIGAYCYCIKELAGYKKSELEFYRRELIDFSNSELKK